MWQSAITNTFLRLKMWQDLCSRKYDWKCNNLSNKYDDREFTKMKLAKPINEGWVFSKDKDSVKIFASYDLDPVTKEITFGDRRMMPTSWVLKMTKLD